VRWRSNSEIGGGVRKPCKNKIGLIRDINQSLIFRQEVRVTGLFADVLSIKRFGASEETFIFSGVGSVAVTGTWKSGNPLYKMSSRVMDHGV
jgi:hypothetical protein